MDNTEKLRIKVFRKIMTDTITKEMVGKSSSNKLMFAFGYVEFEHGQIRAFSLYRIKPEIEFSLSDPDCFQKAIKWIEKTIEEYRKIDAEYKQYDKNPYYRRDKEDE